MPKFIEETITAWSKPPSDTEAVKLENAERMIGDCLKKSTSLSNSQYKIFGQGSYANDTNVRANSDIDINVQLWTVMHIEVPAGKTIQDYGYIPSDYQFSQYKQDIYNALCDTFGVSEVDNTNKCLKIKGNSYRIQADVVPTFKLNWHLDRGEVVNGSWFLSNDGQVHNNYAIQHIEKGKAKNARTGKSFKRLCRIMKRIRYRMIDEGQAVSPNITSFLIECLLYNTPDTIFNSNSTWSERLRQAIIHIYTETSEPIKVQNWYEVSECLKLFHNYRKWSTDDVKKFMQLLWNYLELK